MSPINPNIVLAVVIGLFLGYGFGRLTKLPSNLRKLSILRLNRSVYLVTGVIACFVLSCSAFSYLGQQQNISPSDEGGSLFSLFVWSLVLGQSVGFLSTNVVVKAPAPRFQTASGGKIPIDVIDPTTAELSTLRSYEWHWLNPRKPLPLGLVGEKLLDKITFGWFSRYRLRTIYDPFVWPIDDARFAWECAAIAINSTFAEAYLRRAIDGNYIFMARGVVQRLQGWDGLGNEIFYDIDRAIIDVAIALQFRPNWDQALLRLGELSWLKAKMYQSTNSQWQVMWLNHAREYIQKAMRNPELVKEGQEILDDITRFK